MKNKIKQALRHYYFEIVNSIAFYPAVIALAFLLVSYLILYLDFSPLGKQLKAQWTFFTLKDATTARTITATIAAGILSLTVFSFSMVMILLNQAATNMSNRVLSSLIGNRFQQWVLGFYIGTIVYALFVLSTIRDIDSGVHVPALSVYMLIFLTIIDIFLFIYFIHYITQSVKYEIIIDHIHKETKEELEKNCIDRIEEVDPLPAFLGGLELEMKESGYYQGFNRSELLELCLKHNLQLTFLFPVGTYVLKGVPFVKIKADLPLEEELEGQVRLLIDIYRGESVRDNPRYGFKQLVEVALKALSPGVNDPGTAVLSLEVLVDLLSFRLKNIAFQVIKDKNGTTRIVTKEDSFKDLFQRTLLPIWDYGQNDRILRTSMKELLDQLHYHPSGSEDRTLIENLRQEVTQKIDQKNNSF